MNVPEPIPFEPDWPTPLQRYLRQELPPAPDLPLRDVFGPRLSEWIADAADSKGAPADYVVLSLLSVTGSAIGNARWACPWPGWAEPPVIWSMCIGNPSAGKSPAMDAVLQPLRKAEKRMRQKSEAALSKWREEEEIAAIALTAWKEEVKKATKARRTPPNKPPSAEAGEEPHLPRLAVNDGTIERLATIVANQPRGTLQVRDELAGWLNGMTRYSGGGSDRPFWLEAYGGRGFTVERMSRDPLSVDRLSIGVVGGIQPDRLNTLLLKSDDDGLLARFLPVWPDPAPLKRPQTSGNEVFIDNVIEKLLSLGMITDENGERQPVFVQFDESARQLMDGFRGAVRKWEAGAEGLLLSFTGKLPGLAARLALVLAVLDWAAEGGPNPTSIGKHAFGRAAHLIEAYLLPMARRAYSAASVPKGEKSARRLVAIIREQKWERFTTRDVMRLERAALGTLAALDPVLKLLIEADCIRPVEQPMAAARGRPPRVFAVNPSVHLVQT